MFRLVRTTRLTAVVVLVIGALSACGSSTTTEPDTTPLVGGTLREGLVTVTSTDPALARTVSDRVLADQLFDTLTSWNGTSLAAQPALATRWESSADKRTWTFHLRTDAKAANGQPVVPADVKASFEHLADPKTGSVNADLLGTVQGYAAFRSNPALGLTGIVVGPDAVTFQLDVANGDFDALVGNPVFGVAQHATDGTTSSTGPFMIASRPSPTSLSLVKAPTSSTYLTGIEVTFYPDAASSYADFVAGKLDWSLTAPEAAGQAGQTYGTHLFRPSLRTISLSFNTASPAVADVRYRQAILHAINRPVVASKLTGVDARALNGVVPDGVPGSQGGGCGAACVYDVNAAKTLLAQAFPGATPPTLTVSSSAGAPFGDGALQQVLADLAAAGIPAVSSVVPAEQYAGVTVDPTRGLFQTSWSAAYPRPSAFLAPQFTSTSAANVGNVKVADTDARLAAAETESDPAKRVSDYQGVETQVVADLATVVPIASIFTDSVATSTVRGLSPLPTGNFDASAVWLERAATPPA